MSEKIGERHLARRAILYVRQSTAQQLVHNDESRRLQYAMRERLRVLGWREIDVIDEDLGKSAAGSVERNGFRRLMADVSLGQVGAVAAREVSRFARNSRDWQQLIEICRVVDTLLIDHDAVYAPRIGNDRLLLGLKGSLNEYELELLRVRGLEARREKAARGELVAGVSVGYRRTDDDGIEKTPDARARQVIELVFAKFFELGSARQVMLWLRGERIQLPRNRNQRGDLLWKDATYDDVYRMLTNPAYAGAYAYGRKAMRSRIVDGQLRSGVSRQRRSDWSVLLHDHHEAYISWKEFERIEQMLSKNAQGRGVQGAARSGSALLAGLVWCRRCGHRLGVNYSGTKQSIRRYTCDERNARHGAPKCLSFSAIDVDAEIAKQLLAVVQPAAVEAACRASMEATGVRDHAIEAVELQLQQARYQAQRAERQYDAVDPENRTVALELERRWNAALDLVRSLEERALTMRAARGRTEKPDAAKFSDLADNLDCVWNAVTTDMALKKRIVRTVVEQIWADIDDANAEIALTVHWKGGAHTELRIAKRRSGDRRVSIAQDVVETVRLLARVCNDHEIAQWLGKAGIRTATGMNYTRALVASLRHTRGIEVYSAERSRAQGWLSLAEAAALLDVSPKTLRRAARRKDVLSLHPLPNGPWIFAKSDLATMAAARVTTSARERRERRRAGPISGQLPLTILDT
jgi:DNA invertase Pin-like site-specific DNA recombinase